MNALNFPPADEIHFFCVAYMTGVLWMVQALNYPIFKYIDPARFGELHRMHTMRMTYVVGPMMLVQLGSAFFVQHGRVLCVGLTLANFAFTFFVSVPLHDKLEKTPSKQIMERLILTNWPRTLIWTVHSCVLLFSL